MAQSGITLEHWMAEPSGTPTSFRSFDAVTALTVFVALLLIIPSSLRIPALGGVGYPAAIWALLLGVWWAWDRLRGDRTHANVTRTAMIVFLAACLASYAAAMRRPLPPVEASQADIGLLRLAVAAALVLVASDGIATWSRLLTLIRRLVAGAGLLAGLGVLQFISHRSLISWISLPGFVQTQAYSALADRGGFTRAAGTAMHPLEYSAALALLFPLALSLALHDRETPPLRRLAPAAVIALALAVSGSRSGYLGLVIGLFLLALSWSRRLALRMLVVSAVFAVAVIASSPGLLGTVRGMFLHVGTDPSALSRSGSYTIATELIERNPVFGRGFGTFLPTYRILDNQILLLLVDVGFVGFGAFIGLLAASAWAVRQTSRRLSGQLPRSVGYSLAAGLVSGSVLLSFFDGFAFPIAAGMYFLVIGLCAAFLGCWSRERRSGVLSADRGWTSDHGAAL